ncbi:MAG: S8 family peptidase, partial [Saprospiraceae bacterium]
HQGQEYTLAVTDLPAFRQYLQKQQLKVNIVQEYIPANIVVIKTTLTVLKNQLLPYKGVLFADLTQRHPQEELSVSGLNLGLNQVNLVHHYYPHLNGTGLTASVKEERFLQSDIDFAGRQVATPTADRNSSTHASVMATILGGGGNSYYNSKGAAWGVQLSSTSFDNLLPETNYKDLNISVQNHSYGVGIENYYGAEALAYDMSVKAHPELLHVFSAGNRGTQASESGIYKGLNNIANLTGTFKIAKNVLTVGSLTLTGEVPALSSRGPAYDGRVKPELVALGQDGSSGAAALTSGVAILLQQAFLEKFGHLPDAALIKALLINSADDVDAPGIDFQSGYGNVNAWQALQTLENAHFAQGIIRGDKGVENITIAVPDHAANLKITLVWSDLPANANAPQALVNDLDLELQHSGEVWLPWVLNAFPHPDSLAQLPQRKKDHINNVEQITIERPAAGQYNIAVSAFKLQTPEQLYYVAYQWDTLEIFKWTFPLRTDPVEATENRVLRWQTTLTDTLTTIEYALDGGDWQLLTEKVHLQRPFVLWQAPDTVATAILRLTTGAHVFLSDTFRIDRPADLQVGFNCNDSVMLFWNSISKAKAYRVYELGTKYLQEIQTQTDTFLIINKLNNPTLWYAVEPIFENDHPTFKSYAVNYTFQGVGCYIRNFLATLEGDTAQLELLLGTASGLRRIVFEKLVRGTYIPVASFPATNRLNWQAFDTKLEAGVNIYRARIELSNGGITFSDPVQIYYAGQSGYQLFPNPAQVGQELLLLSRTLEGQVLRVYDTLGREVTNTKPSSEVQTIDTQNLPAGIYQVVVFKNEKRVQHFKLVLTN